MQKIVPVIKWVRSSNAPDLEHYRPSRPEDVLLPIELDIGPKNADSANIFQVLLVGPGSLTKVAKGEVCVSGRHMLLVTRYDWPSIREYLDSLVLKCEGETWEEVAGKLSRYFHWEYEDYKTEDGSEEL